MNLATRLRSTVSILSDLALAAEQRYWDGMQLITQGHFFGGIYWLGFSAEMWLKYAALRFDGLTPAAPWTVGSFAPAQHFMARHPRPLPHEAWHSLRFWSQYLVRRRERAGRPLDVRLAQQLVHRANRLYGTWWVSVRYFPEQAGELDVRRAYDDAGWVRANFDRLWR